MLSGDPNVLPLVHEQLPKHLAEKVIDEITLSSKAPEHEAVARTLEVMRAADARTDREKVEAAVGSFRAGGLGVVGPDATLLALTNGQVDELMITASLANLKPLRRTRAAELAIANDSSVVDSAVEQTASRRVCRWAPCACRTNWLRKRNRRPRAFRSSKTRRCSNRTGASRGRCGIGFSVSPQKHRRNDRAEDGEDDDAADDGLEQRRRHPPDDLAAVVRRERRFAREPNHARKRHPREKRP